MASAIKTRIADILKQSVAAILKPRGYEKRGNTYVQQLSDLSRVIDVQKGRWNTQDQAEFTLNCGIFIPGVLAIYGGRPEPGPPTVPASCISARIGLLTPVHLDKWWKLGANDVVPDTDQEVAEQVRTYLTRYLLPFIESFGSRQDVAAFLESGYSANPHVWPQNEVIRLAYLAILYYLMGEPDRCKETILQAESKARRSPIEAHIQGVRARLLQRN